MDIGRASACTGYMLYDTIYCCYYKQMRSPLIIGHHVLPVAFWPYCTLNRRALPVVLFYIVTEITNVGQHLRVMLLKLGLDNRLAYTMIGVSWVVAFFVVRILPSPYIFYHLVKGNYSAFTTGEFWCAWTPCTLCRVPTRMYALPRPYAHVCSAAPRFR